MPDHNWGKSKAFHPCGRACACGKTAGRKMFCRTSCKSKEFHLKNNITYISLGKYPLNFCQTVKWENILSTCIASWSDFVFSIDLKQSEIEMICKKSRVIRP